MRPWFWTKQINYLVGVVLRNLFFLTISLIKLMRSLIWILVVFCSSFEPKEKQLQNLYIVSSYNLDYWILIQNLPLWMLFHFLSEQFLLLKCVNSWGKFVISDQKLSMSYFYFVTNWSTLHYSQQRIVSK